MRLTPTTFLRAYPKQAIEEARCDHVHGNLHSSNESAMQGSILFQRALESKQVGELSEEQNHLVWPAQTSDKEKTKNKQPAFLVACRRDRSTNPDTAIKLYNHFEKEILIYRR